MVDTAPKKSPRPKPRPRLRPKPRPDTDGSRGTAFLALSDRRAAAKRKAKEQDIISDKKLMKKADSFIGPVKPMKPFWSVPKKPLPPKPKRKSATKPVREEHA